MAQKFMNVDVIYSLESITKLKVQHFQSDFEYDKEMFQKAIESNRKEDKTFLWLSRTNGTHCLKEKNVFMKDLYEYNTVKYYGEHTYSADLLAYVVDLKDKKGTKIIGNLYEMNFQEYYKHLCNISVLVPFEAKLTYQDRTEWIPFEQIDKYRSYSAVEFYPRDKIELDQILKQEQNLRNELPTGNIKKHISKLAEQLQKDTKKSIVGQLKTAKNKIGKANTYAEKEKTDKSKPSL